MAAEPGDRVKVTCQDGVLEGILIQRPEILAQKLFVEFYLDFFLWLFLH